jgi:hypothetical protein
MTEPRSRAAFIADRARSEAARELRSLHEVEYVVLYENAAARLRVELGYVDGRPAANRRRA